MKTETNSINILCVSDIHLGRTLLKLPTAFLASDYSPKQALKNLEKRALLSDILVIGGDLIDRDNDFFEAYPPFEQLVRKLGSENIPVILVAGNHDGETLAKLVDAIGAPNLHFLGRGGEWERVELEIKGCKIGFDGWSFPSSHYPKNPFDEYALPKSDIPLFGVLHTECHPEEGNRYAPTGDKDFFNTPHLKWILGHVHVPSDPNQKYFYPGSLQGLDLTETGVHGGVMIALSPDGSLTTKQEPLAQLRWERIDLDCSKITPDEFELALINRLKIWHSENSDEESSSAVGFHLTLKGEHAQHLQFYQMAKDLEKQVVAHFEKSYFISRVSSEMRRHLNIEELKKSDGILGIVARKIEALKEDHPIAKTWISEAMRAMESVETSQFYTSGVDQPLTPKKAREKLLNSGYALLDTLLAQKEGGELQ